MPEPWEQYNKCDDMFRVGDVAKLAWLQPAGGSTLTEWECEQLVPLIVLCVNACRGIEERVLRRLASDDPDLAGLTDAELAAVLLFQKLRKT